jgi:hypothetical protein
MIEVTTTGGSGVDVAVKTKGYGGAYTAHDTSGVGALMFDFDAVSEYGYGAVMTDSSGVIQIGAANNTSTVTIKLIAYIA